MTTADSLGVLTNFVTSVPRPQTNIILGTAPMANALRRPNLTEDLATAFHGMAVRWLRSLSDATTVPYSAGYKPDAHELVVVPINDNEQIRLTVEAMAAVDQLPLFQNENEVLEHVRFYSLIFQRGNQRAILFRRTTQGFELTRRFPYAAVLNGGTYSRIDHKVLLFDEDFDCLAWNGYLYVRNVGNFQAIFNYFAQLRDQANTTLDAILAVIPISNADAFRTACIGQVQMLSKLASISAKAYLATLSMESIKATAEEYGVALVYENDEGGNERIVFNNSPTERWKILKVLDDDYLKSGMTNERYLTNSKTSV